MYLRTPEITSRTTGTVVHLFISSPLDRRMVKELVSQLSFCCLGGIVGFGF